MRARFSYALPPLAILCWSLLSPRPALAQLPLPPLPGGLVVTMTSPASGSTVASTITVSASVSPAGLLVGGVQFKLDGANLGSMDTTAPYSVSWNTTGASNGSHTLRAVARDALGLQYASSPVTVRVSNAAPPTTTRFEESAANLSPSGAWTSIDSAGARATLSGDSGVYTAVSGARASLAFNGTGVSWIGLPCEICGFAGIYLDGALVATVDTFAASRPAASRSLFTTGGLAAGSHTIVVEASGTQNAASGGANIVVDAFDVEGGASSGGGGKTRIEETDPSMTYAGAWLSQSRGDLSGGSVVESSDANGTASLTFNGTGVSWIGFRGPWAGIAQVYLDGALKATVDTYGPIEQSQVVMYTASGLAAGSHTVMIKVTGTWSSASSSAWVVLDAFDVM